MLTRPAGLHCPVDTVLSLLSAHQHLQGMQSLPCAHGQKQPGMENDKNSLHKLCLSSVSVYSFFILLV